MILPGSGEKGKETARESVQKQETIFAFRRAAARARLVAMFTGAARSFGAVAGAAGMGVLCACLALRFADAARAAPLAPEMLLTGDPAWEDLARLELSGALPVGSTSMRPIARFEVAEWIASASAHRGADPASLARLRRAFARELRRSGAGTIDRETPPLVRLAGDSLPGDTGLDGAASELRVGVAAGLHFRTRSEKGEIGDSTRAALYGVALFGRSVSMQGEIFVGEIPGGRGIGDPLVHGTDILYFTDEVMAAARAGPFRVRLGRGRSRWGPGAGATLLLDDGAAPIASVEWDVQMPAGIRFRSWTGSLNFREERAIAAHRLEIPLGSDLRLAIAEGVRYSGGPGHFLYLLGMLPYTLVQRLDEQDAEAAAERIQQRNNILATAEIVWRPRAGSISFLEFLADDIPAEDAKAPARIGARAGVGILARLGEEPIEIRLEGTKVGRYVYAVDYGDVCACDWIHQGRAIGDPAGPDQEALRLTLGRSAGRDHHGWFELSLANRGGGRLGEAWRGDLDRRASSTLGALRVSAPVLRERGCAGQWRWEPRDNLFGEIRGGVVRWSLGEAGSGRSEGSHWTLGVRIGWRR